MLVSLVLLLLMLKASFRGLRLRWVALPSVIFVFYALAWYGLLSAELLYISPDGTYGSDARYYWNAILSVLHGQGTPLDFAAPLYVAWGSFIILTSPTESIHWLIVSNILLLGISYLLIDLTLQRILERSVSFTNSNAIYRTLTLLNLNGIVVWMVIRGLKEPLIVFILALYIYLLEASPLARHARGIAALPSKLSMMIVTVILFVALNYLRPLGGGLIFPYLIFAFLRRLLAKIRRHTWVFALPVLLFSFAIGYYYAFHQMNVPNLLALFRERFGEESLAEAPPILSRFASEKSLLTLPLAAIRFVLGPGPFRAMEQLVTGRVFDVSTRIGDVLIFLGALQWWILLAVLVLRVMGTPLPALKRTIPGGGFALLVLIIVTTYSYIYFGTGDTRHRAFMYIFAHVPAALILTSGSARCKSRLPGFFADSIAHQSKGFIVNEGFISSCAK